MAKAALNAGGTKSGAMEAYFGIAKAGSTVPRELRAGLTTFLTMSYVLFVNPQVLGSAITGVGNTFAKLLIVTALAAAIGSLLMALVARYPFAQAPGMGLRTATLAIDEHGRQGTSMNAMQVA